MNPLTPVGSGEPPVRLRWMSEVAEGGVAAGDEEAAARWMAPPQEHDPPLVPQAAQRWTIGPLEACVDPAAAGSGIRMTADAIDVASRSAGSCGDDTGKVDSRWTVRATNCATP
jgi:hypothetical protein